MAAICYYGNVMATTRLRLSVTMETLSQHSDNVYFCCWRCVYWACYKCILRLQQYSHRLNLFMCFLLYRSSATSHCGNHWSWVIVLQSLERDITRRDINLQQTDCCNFLRDIRQWRHLLSTVTAMFACPCGHSAGCRMSWVCLQHHATVVISNDVSICGSNMWK